MRRPRTLLKPVVYRQRGAQEFVIEADEAELNLSLGFRSFLLRVNDQVRKRQKQPSKDAKRQQQTLCDMENVHVFNIGIICIHGKELLRQLAFHQDLTMKQMFDISEKLMAAESSMMLNYALWFSPKGG